VYERERERVRVGYNLRIDSWVALAELDEDRAVVDDDLLGVWQLQYVAKENLRDDVLGRKLVPLKRTLSKSSQRRSTEYTCIQRNKNKSIDILW
jgi:hypothetical protein